MLSEAQIFRSTIFKESPAEHRMTAHSAIPEIRTRVTAWNSKQNIAASFKMRYSMLFLPKLIWK